MSVIDLTLGHWRRQYSGFLTGVRLNACTLEAEAWFWRLNVIADDFGNFNADPVAMRNAAGGRRDIPLERAVSLYEELLSQDLIRSYKADGDTYAHIVGFLHLQPPGYDSNRNLRKRAQRCPLHPASHEPEIPGDATGDVTSATQADESSTKKNDRKRRPTKEDDLKSKHKHKHSPPNPPPGGDSERADFQQFFAAYPEHRRQSEAVAWRSWEASENRPAIDELMRILARQKASKQWKEKGKRFTPKITNYLESALWGVVDDSPEADGFAELGRDELDTLYERLVSEDPSMAAAPRNATSVRKRMRQIYKNEKGVSA